MDREDSGEFDDELIEIERASAVLHQRDPEQAVEVVKQVRARQHEDQRREEAARQIRLATQKKRRVRKLRIGIVAGVAIVAGLAAIPLTRAVLEEAERAEALQRQLDQTAQPVRTMGFAMAEEWLDVPPAGVAIEIPRNTCSAIIGVGETSGEPEAIAVAREGNDAIRGRGGGIWCSCDKESVTASFQDPTDQRLALRWLQAKMGVVGGIEVLAGIDVPGFFVSVDDQAFGCADAAFAIWAKTEGHGRLDSIGEKLESALAPLEPERFRVLGVLPPERRFAVVPSRAGRCYMALPFGDQAPLTLRNTQGQRVVENTTRAMGWCSYETERAYSVWRKKQGPPHVLVLDVPAKRVGGLTGLRETASRHGVKEPIMTLHPEDLKADAVAALIGSGIVENTTVEGDKAGLPGKTNSTVAAFGLYDSSSFLPDVAPRVPLACLPERDPQAEFQTYVCVQARPQRWRREGAVETQGAAEGRLPFWLSMLEGRTEESALQAMAQMLAFSRRMSLMEFEPTTTDGVKDSAMGAEVLGRPGKKEMLAVGLSSRPPWIHPLVRGKPWKLDGDLPVISVDPDGSVRVRSRTGTLGHDPNERRVVVWRR